MSTEKDLQNRSGSKCELCSASDNLSVYDVPPEANGRPEQSVFICQTCKDQINDPEKMNEHHWRCLNDSMWSQVPAVQIMAWRLLTRLNSKGWPQDLLDMLYLDDELLAWAQATGEGISDDSQFDNTTIIHKDSNGAVLETGDTVTLIKDLNVKGANFTAKRGTAVRKISLVADNAKHIEGRVEGQQIVILTEFVKKST